MTIEFFIPWKVKPTQTRGVRFARTKAGKSYIAPCSKTKEVRSNQEALILLASQHRPREPIGRAIPIRIEYVFCYSHTGKTAKVGGMVWKPTRPDTGNLTKNLSDCLQAAGFFVDDSQIVREVISKIHTDDPPGVIVTIKTLSAMKRLSADWFPKVRMSA